MTMARYQSTVVDDAGNVVPNAHVEVCRETPGTPLAALKSDRAGASGKSNPFDAEADGSFYFHVVGGAYQIRVYTGPSGAPTFERIYRYVGIGLMSESDIPAASVGVFDQITTSGGVLAVNDETTVPGAVGKLNLRGSDNGTGAGTNISGNDGLQTRWALGTGSSFLGGAWDAETVLYTGDDLILRSATGSYAIHGTGAVLKPATNDGVALGTGALSFSDLFLASGGVVNFNNGDVLITHVTNGLQFSGGTAAGYSFDFHLLPATNDGAQLGIGSFSWSDLFLASGGVINWNNGDVTVTHAANALAFAGASNGYTFDAAAKPASNDGAALGTTALMWSDLFLATGAVLNFNNGDVTITHSANTLAFAGASSGYTFDAAITVDTIKTSAGTLALNDATTASGAVGKFNLRGSDVGSGAGTNVSGNDGLQTRWALGTGSSFLGGAWDAETVLYTADDLILRSANGSYAIHGTTAVLKPATNDGVALGTGALAFSDLFLASGGVLNWNNGDVLATHSANALSFTGASSGYSFDAAINGVTLDNNAWSTYTPTVTSGSGSITAYTATGRYKQRGRIMELVTDVIITTVGTAAGNMIVTLPVNSAAFRYVGSSFDYGATFKSGAGYINGGTNATRFETADATGNWFFTPNVKVVSGFTYETT